VVYEKLSWVRYEASWVISQCLLKDLLMLLSVYETATAMRSYDIYIPVLSEQRVDLHTEYGTSGKGH
jgi:hypothetical protein